MDIVILTTHYPDEKYSNGLTAECHYFARSWVELGHRVLVFHIRPRFFVKGFQEEETSYTMDGVYIEKYKCLRYIPKMYYLSPSQTHQLGRRIVKKIRAEGLNPSMYYVDFCSDLWEIALVVRRLLPANIFPVFHECDLIRQMTAARIVNACRYVGARSKSIADRLKKITEDNTEKSIIVYSGAPTIDSITADIVQKKLSRNRGRRILYAGDQIPRKHVDTLVKALDILNDNDWTLELIGGGPEKDHIDKLIISLGLEKRVIQHDWMTRSEVLAHMANSDYFAMVSHGETFGLVYVEAMACGCITIGSKNEGIDGVINDKQNGLLVNAGSSTELAAALEYSDQLSDHKFYSIVYQALGDAQNFTETAVANRLLEELRKHKIICDEVA